MCVKISVLYNMQECQDRIK